MLGDVLIMSAVFPAGVLEAVGRPCGVLAVAALGAAWFLYGVARLATFAAFSTPRAEAPWSTTDADGAVVVGQGDVTVPAQDTQALLILVLTTVCGLAQTTVACVALRLARLRRARRGGEASESSSDSDDERRRRKTRKSGASKRKSGKAGKGKGQRRREEDDAKRGKRRRKESSSEWSEDEEEDEEDEASGGRGTGRTRGAAKDAGKGGSKDAGKKRGGKKGQPPTSRPPPSHGQAIKPPPPSRPPPPSLPSAPTLTAPEPLEEWYYMDSSNQQMGPVAAATLQQMFDDGVLHASTYVWCEDMDTWKELKDAPLTVKF